MPRRPKTGFDRFFDDQMNDPAFAKEYRAARSQIDTVDAFVRALDAAREEAHVTKAELAKRVGMSPEVLRRLFTTDAPNPTLDTVFRIVGALGLEIGLRQPEPGARRSRRRHLSRESRTGG